jgi:GTPase
MTQRSGVVALVGRPNVGKSTLLNRLIGQKIVSTTHRPQTTRKNALGVVRHGEAELIFVDTPGIHQAKGKLNRFMVNEAEAALKECDVVGWLVEARPREGLTPGNRRIASQLLQGEAPVVLVVNKIDQVEDKKDLLQQIASVQAELGERLVRSVCIAAKPGLHVSDCLDAFAEKVPEGPHQYDEDVFTDQDERSIVAEFIREKVILETEQELPYAAAVTIEAFEDDRPRLVRIIATIHVERDSQKGIVVGQGAERLKAIGTRARKDIEYLLNSKVYLDLTVRCTKNWSTSDRQLDELGYRRVWSR